MNDDIRGGGAGQELFATIGVTGNARFEAPPTLSRTKRQEERLYAGHSHVAEVVHHPAHGAGLWNHVVVSLCRQANSRVVPWRLSCKVSPGTVACAEGTLQDVGGAMP